MFPLKAEVGAALLELDQRNVAGEGRRPANVNRALPINFCGGPDEIVAQFNQCREQIGAGVVDLSFQTPGSEDPGELMEALELFGKKIARFVASRWTKMGCTAERASESIFAEQPSRSGGPPGAHRPDNRIIPPRS